MYGSFDPVGARDLITELRRRRDATTSDARGTTSGPDTPLALRVALSENIKAEDELCADIESPPEIVIAALVDTGGRVPDGDLVIGVTPVFRRFLRELERDPKALYQLKPRQMQELVAGGYESDGPTN